MIKDKNNARIITLGNGTVKLIRSADNSGYIIYESERGEINGEYYSDENVGKHVEDCPEKSIVLAFTGENALKSIDIIMEDLKEIKNTLLFQQKVLNEQTVLGKLRVIRDYLISYSIKKDLVDREVQVARREIVDLVQQISKGEI